MNEAKFSEAMAEARRFLETCHRLAASITNNDGDWDWPPNGSRETGAVKRASMDLTRVLTELRKSS